MKVYSLDTDRGRKHVIRESGPLEKANTEIPPFQVLKVKAQKISK